MADRAKKALKNGHCDPLRSASALSRASGRDAHFLLHTQAKDKSLGLEGKFHQMLAVDEVSDYYSLWLIVFKKLYFFDFLI